MASFITDIESKITTTFISTAYNTADSVASGFTPVFYVGLMLWILLVGYDVAWGKSENGALYAVRTIFRIFIIGTLALIGWRMFIEMAAGLVDAFVSALGGTTTGTVGQTIVDKIFTPLGTTWTLILSKFNQAAAALDWTDVGPMLKLVSQFVMFSVFWGISALALSILGIVSFTIYMIGLTTFSLLVAVGPFFIMCAIFPITQKYTETWTGGVVTAALTMGLALMMLTFAVAAFDLQTVFDHINVVPADKVFTDSNVFAQIGGFLGMGLLMIYMYFKVFDLASSLGGGLNMGNNLVGGIRNIARDIRQSGAARAHQNQMNTIGQGRAGGAGGGGGGYPVRAHTPSTFTGAGIQAAGTGARAIGRGAAATARYAQPVVMAAGRGAAQGAAYAARGAVVGAQYAARGIRYAYQRITR